MPENRAADPAGSTMLYATTRIEISAVGKNTSGSISNPAKVLVDWPKPPMSMSFDQSLILSLPHSRHVILPSLGAAEG